jgi:ribosomal protein S18 acetylase RimI-like enzyme
MKEFDLAEIVAMHLEKIPYSISSKMGAKRLNRMYIRFLKTKKCYAFVAKDSDSNRILGFLTGTLSLRAGSMATLLSLRPIELWRWKSYKLQNKDFKDLFEIAKIFSGINKEYFYITGWCASSDINNPYIGSKLLGYAEEVAISLNKRIILFDTRSQNIMAISKYLDRGYTEIFQTKLSKVLKKSLDS